MDGEKLRDGIFALRTRRFGSVAECMVKRLVKCSLARNLFHDLYDDELHHRIEVKFSVVQKKAERTVTEQTVVQCIEEAIAERRMVAFSEWHQHPAGGSPEAAALHQVEVLDCSALLLGYQLHDFA